MTSFPFERTPDSVETQSYRGYTIELRFFDNPGSTAASMHAYITRGGTSVIVPFSQHMPVRDFSSAEEARTVGLNTARREIDAMHSDGRLPKAGPA